MKRERSTMLLAAALLAELLALAVAARLSPHEFLDLVGFASCAFMMYVLSVTED